MFVCPFCGIATDTPHENQQVCLTALAAEIARLRRVLEQSESAAVPTAAGDLDEPEDPESKRR